MTISTEKRQAVWAALKEDKERNHGWSKRLIGRMCGVDSNTVRAIAAEFRAGADDESSVYFIMAGKRFVKIGFTHLVRGRIGHFQTGCPLRLRLLACVPGTPADERTLHKAFAVHRERGEWFRLVEPIRRYIKAVKAAGRLLTVEEINGQGLE